MKRIIILAIVFIITAVVFYYLGKEYRYVPKEENTKTDIDLNTILKTGDIIRDYDFYKKTLTDLHPGLYKWHTPEEFNALFDSIGLLLKNPTSYAQFYTYLSIINNRIGCSHTSLDFHEDFSQSGFFPVPIVSIENAYYSTCSECNVPRGSKLLYINGEKMEDIAERLAVYESVDACNRFVSLQKITQNFRFKYFLAFGSHRKFDISYEDPVTKHIKTTSVEGEPNNFIYPADWHPFWYNHFDYDLSVLDSIHTAILKLRTFTYDDVVKADGFRNFVENSFRLLSFDRSCNNLVIDLRNNPGGENKNCYLLYSYLTNRGFYEDSLCYMNNFEFPTEHILTGYSNEYLDSVRTTNFVLNNKQTQYRIRSSKIKKWTISPYAFKGNVFVITNSVTASAGVRLSALLQINDSATVVGETPEGAYSGSTSYYYKKYLLSNSGISFTIPLISAKYNVRAVNHSPELLPDYTVPLDREDFLSGKDTQLEFILKKLIKN